MRRWRGLGLALLAGAVAALAWGLGQGDLQVALFLVFPVVYGSGPWGVLGILLLVGAFLAFAADALATFPGPPPGGAGRDPTGSGWGGEGRRQEGPGARSDPWDDAGEENGGGWLRGGGLIMLGPIPIVLGSDRRTTMILMALAVLLMAMGLAWIVLGSR